MPTGICSRKSAKSAFSAGSVRWGHQLAPILINIVVKVEATDYTRKPRERVYRVPWCIPRQSPRNYSHRHRPPVSSLAPSLAAGAVEGRAAKESSGLSLFLYKQKWDCPFVAVNYVKVAFMPKAFCIAGAVVAILLLVIFAADLIPGVGFPFGGQSMIIDIGMVVCSLMLGYISWATYRTLK